MAEPAPEADFLLQLFATLHTEGVRYAVMRNHESLPHSSGGSDLDIFVMPQDFESAKRALRTAVENLDGKVIGVVQTWNFFEAYIIGFSRGQWWGVCVEFYNEIAFKSAVTLVDSDVLSTHIELHNNISVVSTRIGNAIGFIKELISNHNVRKDKPNYERGAKILLENAKLFRDIFSPLGWRARALLDVIIRELPHISRQNAKKFRGYSVMQAFIRRPLFFVYRRLGHEFFRLIRFINPPGVVVAILGVDGAGKSTIINSILPSLRSATHNAVFVQHLRPMLLPPLALLKGRKHVRSAPVLEPHSSTPSGKLGSLFRLFYLTFDYLVGYWLWTRPKIAKRPALVIFDRYAYDMGLDPRRFRIGIGSKVAGWFASFAPKPDLIICLNGSPEVIAARKQELSVEETRRQIEALRAFAQREPRAVMIATDTSIDETRDRVLNSLCELLQAKALKSL